ncbi:MAG: flagellar hook-basal body complex protein FliE [Terricaulis sp.]
MTGLEALAGVDRIGAEAVSGPAQALATAAPTPAQTPEAPSSLSFGDIITRGIANVETRIDNANRLVRAFALDDSVPLHEVTIALEEARLAVELTSTIRARLVESYREIMNTQL